MKKTIELKGSIARLLNKEPFLMPDELELDFKHVGYDLSNAFITLKNGEKVIKEKLSKPYKIPEEILFAGDLHIKIEMFLSDEKAKEWNSPAIRIVETEMGLQVSDLLFELEEKIVNTVSLSTYNEMIKQLNTLIEKHNTLAETVSELKENF